MKFDNMNINDIIDIIEDMVNKSASIPLSGKILVSKEEIMDQLNELRAKYPEELEEAKSIIERRDMIIEEAEREADRLRKSTSEQIIRMVDENEVTRAAYTKADELQREAYENAEKLQREAQMRSDELRQTADQYISETRSNCYKYTNDMFEQLETQLLEVLNHIRNDRDTFNKSQE